MTARNDPTGQPTGDEHQRFARYQQDLTQVREEDEAELLATPIGQAAPVPPGVTPTLLAALWQERRPLGPPIAHTFRSTYADRWVRSHSLPDSKRYPESEDEYAIALDRHNTVLDELFTGLEVFVVTVEWSSTPTGPEHYPTPRQELHADGIVWWIESDQEDPDPEFHVHTRLYADQRPWRHGCVDELLRAVADDVLGGVFVTDAEIRRIYHPYDGGADVILATPRNETSFATGTPTGSPATQPVFDKRELLDVCPRDPRVHRIRTAVGDDAWLVTGYEQVRGLLDDDRLGRSHRDPGNAARTGESALFGGPLGEFETEHADRSGCARCCSRTSRPSGCARCDRVSSSSPPRSSTSSPITGRLPTCTRRWRCRCRSR